MIRINLLRDRRVKPAGGPEEAPTEPFPAPEPDAGPSMGVGFDDYARADEVYFPTTKRFNSFHLALIISGVVLAGLIVWSFIAADAVDEARTERDGLEAALTEARSGSAELDALIAQHDALGRRIEALKLMSSPGGSAERYLDLLQAVNEAVPQRDIWLSELREREGSVQLKGNTYNHFALADILEGLIDDPAISAVRQGGAQSIDVEGSRVLQFDFSAKLD